MTDAFGRVILQLVQRRLTIFIVPLNISPEGKGGENKWQLLVQLSLILFTCHSSLVFPQDYVGRVVWGIALQGWILTHRVCLSAKTPDFSQLLQNEL